MKTQLLEDIGENAALPLAPSRLAGHSKAGREVHTPAPEAKAEPAMPRVAPGMQEQAPASEPLISTTQQQPEQDLMLLELDSVFEEIAALEAQLVAPRQQHAPADTIAPVEPRHELPTPAPDPEHKPATPTEEIAALEAQLAAPGQQHVPVNTIAPVAPRQELSTPPAAPEHKPATPTAERLLEPATSPIQPRNKLASPPAERLLQAAAPRTESLHKPAVPPAQFLHTLAIPPAGRLLQAVAPPAAPLHTPALPPAEPLPEPVTPSADRLLKPAVPPGAFLHTPAATPAAAPAAPTLVVNPPHSAPAPQDPLFDFTPPPPAAQAADPFTRPPTGLTRSGRRYLLWGACVLSGALLTLGGRWLYQERNDAGSLALIADEAKAAPQANKAALKPPAIAANESMQGPDGDTNVAPAAPASRPSSGVPPLVLLEPEAVAAARPEPPAPSVTERVEPETPPKPEPVAQRKAASPLPKPLPKPASRPARERSSAAAQPARERSKREPVRQLARASAIEAERPAEAGTSMTATLKACRERGYGPAQCVKRGCSVTRYGFACRGR